MKLNVNKEKIYKIIKVFIIILILLLVLRKIHEIYITYDGKLDKSNPMSREEVIELLDKGNQNNNNYLRTIYYTIENKRITQKIYTKDNLVKQEDNGNTIMWKNLETLETIMFGNFPEAEYHVGLNFADGTNYYYNTYKQHMLDKENYNFEYLGEKDFNNRKTIIIKLTFGNYDKNYEKIFIDKETGIIVNEIFIYYNHRWHILEKSGDKQTVEFDIVTDEDVRRPSTDGWVIHQQTAEE